MNLELSVQSKGNHKTTSIPDLNKKNRQLISEAIAGNSQSLNDLATIYYPYVHRIAKILYHYYRASFFYENADDITQNVMIRFGEIIANFAQQPDQSKFSGFLNNSIHHIAIDMAKKNLCKKRFQIFLRYDDSQETIAESELNDFQSDDFKPAHQEKYTPEAVMESCRIEVQNCFSELEKQRPDLSQIIYSYYWLDLDDTEIADKIAIPRNKVWRYRQSALKQLKAIIAA